jgi:hypothetical protein
VQPPFAALVPAELMIRKYKSELTVEVTNR